MTATWPGILNSAVMQNTIHNIFGGQPFSVIERTGAYVLLLAKEPKQKIQRIMVLKPNGFTSNKADELSSHPEAIEATIEIKGTLRPHNKGYSLPKNCVEFLYCPSKQTEILENAPYADAKNAVRTFKNARTRFKIVKKNGFGFYHNLLNKTDDFLVLVLRKKIDQIQPINWQKIQNRPIEEQQRWRDFIEAVSETGDEIFKLKPELVATIEAIDPSQSIPILITVLNIPEGSKHEQCTVYAIILKLAKKNPSLALEIIQNARRQQEAQEYYLEELEKKIATKPVKRIPFASAGG